MCVSSDKSRAVLESASDPVLAKLIIDTFVACEKAYWQKNWKHSGIEVGHFVEAVVRLIELKSTNSYTPVGKSIPALLPDWLKKCEQNPALPDGYRFHIPRLCLTIYGMRNKNGYGHLSINLCERIDSQIMLDCSRWILCELIHMESSFSKEETDALVKSISDRPLQWIWLVGDKPRLLRDFGSLKNDLLVLMYYFGETHVSNLITASESSGSYVRKVLGKLHKDKLVSYDSINLKVEISPLGSLEAEKLLSAP